ncbi:MAG: ATP-binding cassette domain-containing protein [Coriobacteriia bacterium]|nr:ATP-binding cassette domain-containing protein [Coriobacteriia bacterium]
MSDREIAVRAERVRLSGGDRRVYPATTFEIPAGSVAAFLGASGTGKTSLLLTIAGRMRGWHGCVEVDGVDAARHSARVRGLVGMGVMAGVNDLAEALTPAQHVTEAHVFVPRLKRSVYRDVLAEVGLDAAAHMQVKRLDAEQRIRLGIALAIVRDVRVIVVDDLDRDLNQEERTRVLALLHKLAEDGLTVLFACVDEATASHADIVIPVEDVEPVSPISSRGVRTHAVA